MANSLLRLGLTFALITLIYSEVAKIPPLNSETKTLPIILITNSQPTNPNSKVVPVISSSSSLASDNTITPFFLDTRGSSTTDEQIASFKNYITLASAFYRYDANARLDYISNKMNETYGVNRYGFTVVIHNTSSHWGWITSSYNGVWASIIKGHDIVFPQASYMFLRDPINSGRSFFHRVGDKGDGIDAIYQSVINNVILSAQTGLTTCYCGGVTSTIYEYLGAFDNGVWNVYCSSQENQYLAAYTKSNKFIVAKPGYCYYAIYDMKI